jgi:hypothetical protein
MDNIVNEGSTAAITLRFKDENNRNVTPNSVTWSVYDVTNGVEVVADTVEIPTSFKHVIYIPPTANEIDANSTNIWEERLVTVTFVYATTNQGTEEFKYYVKNLNKIA